MLSGRQEKLLNFLIKEYISTAEPVSSLDLKKVTDLDVCGATIRNDLQALTEEGYIEQPHTSAGIPEAFNVMVQELRGLALDIRVYDAKGKQIALTERDEDIINKQGAF